MRVLVFLRAVKEGMTNALSKRMHGLAKIIEQNRYNVGNGKSQNDHKKGFWITEFIQKCQQKNLNFRHDDAFLSVSRGHVWNVRQGLLSLSHTYLRSTISQVMCLLESVFQRKRRVLHLLATIGIVSLWGLPAQAAGISAWAQVLYVIDGDTFSASVKLPDGNFLKTNIRVARIDTPEKEKRYGADCEAERRAGYAASDYAKNLLPKYSKVKLASIRPGKYAGRLIADVTLPDGRDYGQIMLQSGHAIPYYGGHKRKVWCK